MGVSLVSGIRSVSICSLNIYMYQALREGPVGSKPSETHSSGMELADG